MDLDGASRNLTVAALLTLSGGYLGRVHGVGHGHVFANTMTATSRCSASTCRPANGPPRCITCRRSSASRSRCSSRTCSGFAAAARMKHTAFASLLVEIVFSASPRAASSARRARG